jgi:hypothetical protein
MPKFWLADLAANFNIWSDICQTAACSNEWETDQTTSWCQTAIVRHALCVSSGEIPRRRTASMGIYKSSWCCARPRDLFFFPSQVPTPRDVKHIVPTGIFLLRHLLPICYLCTSVSIRQSSDIQILWQKDCFKDVVKWVSNDLHPVRAEKSRSM